MSYETILKDYRTYINAGAKMRAHIKANLVKGALPDALVAGFAKVHAQCYQCEVILTDEGGYRFKTAKGDEHKTAQQQWRRQVDPYHKRARSNRGGNRNKVEQVKPRKTKQVSQLLVMFNDLSAEERAAFLAEAK